MTTILVTGANGQLGWELQQLAPKFGQYQFIFTDVDQLNITQAKAVEAFFSQQQIDIIINCAAYTAVDKAETDRETAFLINTMAVDILIDAALKSNATLFHVSTDYVFDGTKNTPYTEDNPTIPMSAYGETKNEGEKLILYSDINAAIIRTSWLYSTHGNNFVKTMLKVGPERGNLNVVFDQVGSPTYARDLAKAILQMIPAFALQRTQNRQEIYHYTNEGVTSWYDFACEIFRYSNITCQVNPILTCQYPTPAKRPAFSVLDKSKIKADFTITIPHWADSLHQMMDTLAASK